MAKITVKYHRYGKEFEKSFTTQAKAAQWVLDQEFAGSISYDVIINSRGEVIADNDIFIVLSETGSPYDQLRKLGAKG